MSDEKPEQEEQQPEELPEGVRARLVVNFSHDGQIQVIRQGTRHGDLFAAAAFIDYTTRQELTEIMLAERMASASRLVVPGSGRPN